VRPDRKHRAARFEGKRKVLNAAKVIGMRVFEIAKQGKELQALVALLFDGVIEQAERFRRFIG